MITLSLLIRFKTRNETRILKAFWKMRRKVIFEPEAKIIWLVFGILGKDPDFNHCFFGWNFWCILQRKQDNWDLYALRNDFQNLCFLSLSNLDEKRPVCVIGVILALQTFGSFTDNINCYSTRFLRQEVLKFQPSFVIMKFWPLSENGLRFSPSLKKWLRLEGL